MHHPYFVYILFGMPSLHFYLVLILDQRVFSSVQVTTIPDICLICHLEPDEGPAIHRWYLTSLCAADFLISDNRTQATA